MEYGIDHLKEIHNRKKRIIGCFPIYPPLELFHSINIHPFILWGFKKLLDDTHRSDEHVQDFVCSVERHLVEFVLSENGNVLDGIFFYNTCDSLRNTPEILQEGLKSKGKEIPFFNFHLPMKSMDKPYSREYLKNEVNHLIEGLEDFTQKRFSFSDFKRSVQLYGEVRKLAEKLEDMIIQNNYSYKKFIKAITELNYLSIERQIELLKSLIKNVESKKSEMKRLQRKKVILSGIMPPPLTIISIMEELGLKIVGNDIAYLSRLLSTTPNETRYNDVGSYYVEFYKNHYPCSTLLYTTDARPKRLIELVNSSNAEGIIFIGEKFCEYEYFEFPTLQETLKSNNIPSLLLEFSIEESLNIEAYKTRIQAFQELLENRRKEARCK